MASTPGSRSPGELAGRVVAITGANSGIGKEAAVTLASSGATVVLACRDATRGQAARAEVRERTGSEGVEVIALDLADFASIRAFADQLTARHDRLDVLVNNAGAVLSARTVTAQGFESTFGVNHLGHFLLTELLRDRLVMSAPARIVTVASTAHHYALTGLSFTDLQSERGYHAYDAYAKSKLANILFTRELARRLDDTGVTANCLHPGAVRTGFASAEDTSGFDRWFIMLGTPFFISAERGSRTISYLAASSEVERRTGGYYVRNREHRPSRAARDDDAARRLWEASEDLIANAGA
jgi:NAD(P)-dependent dehydrogenase (short-subunit alcohol dehydrogenase family)